ncbi:MAG: tyrosine-type recombinase/integrase [Deltaproteobacteria bacterium]|nr:tyrosine-type recombinase/integrase [Deltaproteobacteria bacterium]
MAEILAQPDLRNRGGRRDAVLLSILYDTGARVQELIDLSAGDVRLDPPAQVRLMGKGRKMRAVPLMDKTVQLLRDHMHENHLDRPEQFDRPLFRNRGERERDCGRPITNGTTHGTNPSAAAESAFPEGT